MTNLCLNGKSEDVKIEAMMSPDIEKQQGKVGALRAHRIAPAMRQPLVRQFPSKEAFFGRWCMYPYPQPGCKNLIIDRYY